MVENRLQRPSGVYVCPVFSSRTCVHARHIILMVLHVLYQVIISNKIYLMCNALCDDCLPRSFCYFFFLCYFAISFFNFFFSLKLLLICSYFSGDLSLTVLIKCVLIKKSEILLSLYSVTVTDLNVTICYAFNCHSSVLTIENSALLH